MSIDLQTTVADQQVLAQALWRLLEDVVIALKENKVNDVAIARLDELVRESWPEVKRTLVCECGHVNADHDDKGCTYIGCKPICGKK